MQAQISIREKKDFLKHFLNVYELKRQEGEWLLTYLMKNEQLLTHIHFVKDAKYCPRAMVVSATCSDQVPFLFYKGHVVTDNPDKLFHDIRLNPKEPLYVQLNTNQLHQEYRSASILDVNPYVPGYLKAKKEDQENADELLHKLQFDYQKQALETQIDKALEKKDKTEFLRLAELLEQLP